MCTEGMELYDDPRRLICQPVLGMWHLKIWIFFSKLCYYSGRRELPSFIVSYVNFYRIGVDIMSLSFIAKENKFITPPSRQPPLVNSIMFQSSWEGLTGWPIYSIIQSYWSLGHLQSKQSFQMGLKHIFYHFISTNYKCKNLFKDNHI